MSAGLLDTIITPAQGNRLPEGAWWIADNGCGPGRDGMKTGKGYPGDAEYLAYLKVRAGDAGRCLFAVAPDVVGDAKATLARSAPMLAPIRALGYPVALVAQNGLEDLAVPWDDFDVLFIGGDDEFKLGRHARALTTEAKRRGKWVHMGRVNSEERLRYAGAIGCDSADGTFIAFGPDINLPIVLGWLRKVNDQGVLFEGVAS